MLRKVIASYAMRHALCAKDLALCLLSAALLILSFPRSNFWIFAWVGFVPLFFALQNKSKIKAFLLSYITGIIFWAGIVYWLGYVTIIGTVVLVLYLALYFGIFGMCLSSQCLGDSFREKIVYHYGKLSPIFLPSAWIVLEYIRSHLFTGFPWALLGYSQCNNLAIIQIADITGAYGVSFLIIMVNVTIYALCVMRYASCAMRRRQQYLWVALLMIFVLAYGFYQLSPTAFDAQRTAHSAQRTALKISIVQPNIPQELKWDPKAIEYILKKYFSLTEIAAKDKPDLIVWPEASSPGLLGEDDYIFDDIFSLNKKIQIPLLIGAVSILDENYFNSALLIESGAISQHYNKLHLVPFGEYIPLKKYFPFLETIAPIGDIMRGNEYTIFAPSARRPAQDAIKFSVLICFEDVFPELSREFVRRGADLLINITNDAWYKQTSAAYQHFQASVFRAVENRRFLVRSANTGVSGFIFPTGKVISLVHDSKGMNIFVDGIATERLDISKLEVQTFYTKYGDLFVIACFLVLLYGIISALKKKR